MNATNPALIFLLTLCAIIEGLNAQQIDWDQGYDVKSYLSQTNIQATSVSPNGEYLAFITSRDNFKKNKTIKKLWLYQIDPNKGKVLKKSEVAIFKNIVSQINWTNDSKFLIFKSKDSLGSSLFKTATNNPSATNPVSSKRVFASKFSSYEILQDDKILFLSKEKLDKQKKSFVQFPKKPSKTQSTLKIFSLKTEKVDSLFSIERNVIGLDISPDEKRLVFRDQEVIAYYDNDMYKNSHSFLINTMDGKNEIQLTNDYVGDRNYWYGNDKLFSFLTGDPKKKYYNTEYNALYITDVKTNSRKNIGKNFKGRIRSYIVLQDQTIIINAEQSTSSNFYVYENNSFKKITNLKGTIANLKSKNNKNLMVFSMTTDNDFEEVFIARSTEELKTPIRITNFNTELNSANTPIVEKVVWQNTSGETIEGVLLWPPGKKRVKNLPLAVDIHGGPRSSRSEAISLNGLQYYYYASLLASKGFLVLQPNYRGSTGRGQKFVDAINGAPSSRPADDILTGVEFLIEKGWVNKGKMIIKGASYGGQLTNWIIGNTNMFAAALPSCGVWNEITSFGTSDGEIGQKIKFNQLDYWEDPELFRKESAYFYAQKIKTPTLITHGENDIRVPTHNAYAMYYTLKELGANVELFIYKGEGHLYKKPANKLEKVKAEIDFIKKHIVD